MLSLQNDMESNSSLEEDLNASRKRIGFPMMKDDALSGSLQIPGKGFSDDPNPYLNEILENQHDESSSDSIDLSMNDSDNIERFDEIFLENNLQRQVNKLLDQKVQEEDND